MAATVCGALWAILNALISPIFWQLSHMPFLCDLLAFTSLTLVVWWTRKLGAATLTGVVVAALTLILNPAAFHIFAFMAASIIFDIATKGVGYHNCLDKVVVSMACVIFFSTLSAGLAGAIIGSIFMDIRTLTGVLTFAGLHAVGGTLGGAIGFTVIRALAARRIHPSSSL